MCRFKARLLTFISDCRNGNAFFRLDVCLMYVYPQVYIHMQQQHRTLKRSETDE